MADGINKVILLGNLGLDPELRETSSAGKSVCNFRMSTNSSHGRGEFRQDRTEWHQVVVWGRLAEMCAEFLHKGSRIYLEGHLQTRKWEDKRGQDRLTTEIVTEKIVFIGGKKDRETELKFIEQTVQTIISEYPGSASEKIEEFFANYAAKTKNIQGEE